MNKNGPTLIVGFKACHYFKQKYRIKYNAELDSASNNEIKYLITF